MERTLGLIACLLVAGFMASAEDALYRERIYNAYRNEDMQAWNTVVMDMENARELTLAQQWELLDYYYGQIGHYLTSQQNEKATLVLKKATSLLELLEHANGPESMVQAYQAAFLGFRSTMTPLLGPILGMRSLRMARKAVASDPQNWRAWMELGHVTRHAPELVGGGQAQAIQYYKKALALTTTREEDAPPNWRVPHLMSTIANIQNKKPDPKDER